ncbi:hypothetical protein HYV50_04180 [Candidatus Pacearchaeota archaeon]|nr:hypothetical protein [Candidatus Pacearchaeota archaeon]
MEKVEKQVKEFLGLCERARKGIKEWESETIRLKQENKDLKEELARKEIEKRK